MHHLSLLHRFRSKDRTQHYRSSFPMMGVILFALLLIGVQFLPTSFSLLNVMASTNPKPAMQKASFTLDGVMVNVNTPFLPEKFVTSKPGDATQTAVASTPDLNAHPYGTITITAVPFETKPMTEGVPIAQSGGALSYRTFLHTYRANEGDHPQPGPTIRAFGQNVPGEVSLMLSANPKTITSTLVIEWVVEAGRRLWIVRITQELAVGATNLTASQSLLSSFSYLTLSSTTLNHLTTLKVTKTPQAASTLQPATVTSQSLPIWWNNKVCDSDHYTTTTPHPLASWQGVYACGPRPFTDNPGPHCTPNVYPTSIGDCYQAYSGYEWECVELSMRFMNLEYHVKPYSGNGNQVVTNYSTTELKKTIVNSNVLGSTNPIGPGDILSWNVRTFGHTSVVTSVTHGNNLPGLDSTGTGTITTMEQNWSSTGTHSYSVSNWTIAAGSYGTLIGWLHDPNGGSSGGGVSPSPTLVWNPSLNHQEAFATATDGTIWHDWVDSTGGWAHWAQTDATYTFQGSPAVVWNASQNHLEMFATATDGTIWHDWVDSTGGWGHWAQTQSGLTFQGSPAIVYNASLNYPEVIAIATDGTIWHDWPNSTGGWGQWAQTQSGLTFQ